MLAINTSSIPQNSHFGWTSFRWAGYSMPCLHPLGRLPPDVVLESDLAPCGAPKHPYGTSSRTPGRDSRPSEGTP